jgi:hypothetical protein
MGYEMVTVHLVTHLVPEKGTHPELEVSYAPPAGQSLDEATTVVHGDNELAEYILEMARRHGPWKKLTTRGWEALARANTEQLQKACFSGI